MTRQVNITNGIGTYRIEYPYNYVDGRYVPPGRYRIKAEYSGGETYKPKTELSEFTMHSTLPGNFTLKDFQKSFYRYNDGAPLTEYIGQQYFDSGTYLLNQSMRFNTYFQYVIHPDHNTGLGTGIVYNPIILQTSYLFDENTTEPVERICLQITQNTSTTKTVSLQKFVLEDGQFSLVDNLNRTLSSTVASGFTVGCSLVYNGAVYFYVNRTITSGMLPSYGGSSTISFNTEFTNQYHHPYLMIQGHTDGMWVAESTTIRNTTRFFTHMSVATNQIPFTPSVNNP